MTQATKDTLKDLGLTLLIILLLIPIFLLTIQNKPNILTIILLILLLIPTILALINGAPFVPTPIKAVKTMIKKANIKDGDIIYDIGCGDGRIVHLASKQHKIKAIGIELSPLVYLLAITRKILWKSKAKIKLKNFKTTNLKDANIIFCYLLPKPLTILIEKIKKECKKGTKIISYTFPIKNLKETEKIPANKKEKINTIYIYKI